MPAREKLRFPAGGRKFQYTWRRMHVQTELGSLQTELGSFSLGNGSKMLQFPWKTPKKGLDTLKRVNLIQQFFEMEIHVILILPKPLGEIN